MPLFHPDGDKYTLRTKDLDVSRNENWRDVRASWVAVTIVAPLISASVTSFFVAVALAYTLGSRAPNPPTQIETGFYTFVRTMIYLTPVLWLIWSGSLARLVHWVERVTHIDIDGGGVGTGKPIVTPLILNANAGRRVAEENARKRERQNLEEFIRFVDERPANTRVRALNDRFKSAWPKYKKMLEDAGYIEYDEPNRPNSTWHLALDAESLIIELFQAENQNARP